MLRIQSGCLIYVGNDMIYDMIWYDTIWYMVWYDMIYLLTEIGLTSGGSGAVHIYTQTIHRTAQWNRIHGTEHI